MFDKNNDISLPTFMLSTRSGDIIGPIPACNISIADDFTSCFETSFDVYKYDNGNEYDYWDDLIDFKLAYSPDYDVWLELYVEKVDDGVLVKHVSGRSLGDAELSQISVNLLEVNTEEDIDRDDYEPTVLYDRNNKNRSLIDKLLEKAPHYSVNYVAPTIASIQRSFSFDGTTIRDALSEIAEEMHCIFVIDSGRNSYGAPKREINAYDLESYCVDCGLREEFSGPCPSCGSDNIIPGYGEDTTVLVSIENLADDITYSTDNDSVKNCFKLSAGDDLMTATIVSCNPNGSEYIWYISDDVRNDMSRELRESLAEYDRLYNEYAERYSPNVNQALINDYNSLVLKYSGMNPTAKRINTPLVGYPSLVEANYNAIDMILFLEDAMMPTIQSASTTASAQAAMLSSGVIAIAAVSDTSKVSLASANSAVLNAVNARIHPMYQSRVYESSLTGMVWTGRIKLTNYSDEDDTAITAPFDVVMSDDFETTIKQRLDMSLGKNTDELTNIVSLFHSDIEIFKNELTKYCLNSLQTFEKICEACLNIMIENGVSDSDMWSKRPNNLYSSLYEPYYEKFLAIKDEIKTREAELSAITALRDDILDWNEYIQRNLNFKDYIGDRLWKEFSSYRRDDVYQNDNYVSDGLNNKELLENALLFLSEANKEIKKSATLQHSITAGLKNLLVMKEFKPIVDMFQVGNWIRVSIDDVVYRLRLISYETNYEDLSDLSVSFSDVQIIPDDIYKSKEILSRAASMATSYDSVRRQSKRGSKGRDQLIDWADKGLALTKLKIVDDADMQNISWDDRGLLCRRYDEITDEYDSHQLKIINKGLYLTDDNWRTSKAGIGEFTFYNPKTGQVEEAYGVIANTLVGSLILGEEVGVYTENGSITMDGRGLTIISDGTGVDEEKPQPAFSISRKMEDEDNNIFYNPICYIDDHGEFVLNGNIKILPDENISDAEYLNNMIKRERIEGIIMDSLVPEVDNLNRTIDDKYNELHSFADTLLKDYKDEVSQYMTFDEGTGLTIGAVGSVFSTNIRNDGMWFLQKDGDTDVGVAYIMNKLLYIPNAQVTSSFVLGRFFFSPRGDGGMSITWQEE